MPELPPDWQDQMVAMIRGTAPLDGRWFTGSRHLSPEAQIGVYATMYRHRLVDAVLEESPGLAAWWGDAAHASFLAYITDTPSRSWTLNRVADGLVDWLVKRDADIVAIEIARLDAAVQGVFEAADGHLLDPAEISMDARFVLQPHVRLLRLTHDVHHFRSAVLTGAARPEVAQRTVPLVLFRRERKVRHWEVGEAGYAFLDALRDGATLMTAIEAAHAVGAVSEDQLGPWVGTFCREIAERAMVVREGAW